MNRKGIVGLLDAADQERVRADLAVLFGPRAQIFQQAYEKMRAKSGRGRMQAIGWNWPALFVPFAWFFFRKMYLYGAVILLLPILIEFVIDIPSGATIGLAIVVSMYSKSWYVQKALGHIAEADARGLAGAERAEYFRRVGGVSVLAGTLAGLLYAAIVAFVLLAVVQILRSPITH